jgi:hypothetical protein
MLRIRGEVLDPEACDRLFSVPPDSVWLKGHRRPGSGRVRETSGLQFLVSSHDGHHVPLQIQDALAFLRQHGDAIRAALALPTVDEAFLDFAWYFPTEAAAQFNRIPPELCRLCGDLGVGIEFSVYSTTTET